LFKYTNVEITRSSDYIFTVAVPPWEVAVLAAANGEDRCFVKDEIVVRHKLPEAVDEYNRLLSRYGNDNDNGQPYVAMVYGVGAAGVRKLGEEIARVSTIAEGGSVKGESPAGDAETVTDDELKALGLFTEVPKMAEGARVIEQ
jgi:hypothetical protein